MVDELLAPETEPKGKLMPRETPDVPDSRAALVKRWADDIIAARVHWGKDFARMRRNMAFAAGKQWPNQKDQDDRFMVNIVQRVIKTNVAASYAKNPTVIHKRREKLDFLIWDGRAETAVQAQQVLAMAQEQATLNPNAGVVPEQVAAVEQAMALLKDIQQGVDRRNMIDKIGKTLVACMNYYVDECIPGFKLQMKQMVRRARTTGVGYVSLGYQRAMDLSPDQKSKLNDMAERLALIGRLAADLEDGETDPNAAEAEELKLAMAALQAEPEVLIREGLVFNFPGSTRLIPSINTEKLMGWVGCDFIAEEIYLHPDRVKEVYGVDLGKDFSAYRTIGGANEQGEMRRIADRKRGLACVWRVFDKTTGMEFTLCEGYPDFLREPASPQIFIEQFFPYFAVTFNESEEEGKLFPQSDVELMLHVQKEYNRSKEARRQHRYANRPLYLSPDGALEEEEEKSLSGYEAHSVIKVRGLEKGRPSTDLLAPVDKIGLDPNLYETADLFVDMQRVTGNAEANLGGTGNSTATESSIAEASRQGSVGLDSDDLDDMLTALFRSAGQILLTELDEATVKEIAGPGAVWPQFSRADAAKEMWLEIKAGSSGRPNQAREAANFERVYPLLVQVPGVSPRWLAEKAVRIADDDVDLEDAVIDGIPSIIAQNAMAQPATGDPASEPTAQGDEGKNKERSSEPGGTGQPEYPGAGAGGALQ